ncbi:MAG: hypothetical protein QM768_12935 [Agriterribacter sp.]
MSNATIVERYHELYRIEQAFRMSESDLQARPVFHYKEDFAKLHSFALGIGNIQIYRTANSHFYQKLHTSV